MNGTTDGKDLYKRYYGDNGFSTSDRVKLAEILIKAELDGDTEARWCIIIIFPSWSMYVLMFMCSYIHNNSFYLFPLVQNKKGGIFLKSYLINTFRIYKVKSDRNSIFCS